MKLSNEIIREFNPCYDPASIGIPDGEVLSITDWVNKYRKIVKSEVDIVWLLTRNDFMSDKDLRLFAVWCAREALKLVKNPDHRSIEACNVAERYANGDATTQELSAAESAALSAAWATVWSTARSATKSAAKSAAESAASEPAVMRPAQVDKLLTYFK